jgi:hypothetical protein
MLRPVKHTPIFRPLKERKPQEYVWYSVTDERILLLPMKPAAGREDVPHDLQVDLNLEIMELYFIGEF